MPVGATPTHVAVGEDAIWVTNTDGGSVSRIDPVKRIVVEHDPGRQRPERNRPRRRLRLGDEQPGGHGLEDRPDREQRRGGVVDTMPVGNGPAGIAYAAGSIWVANTGDNTITRIDAGSDKPSKPLPIAATELAFGDGTLWASDTTANRVVRIDPTTGRLVYPIGVGNGPSAIAFGSGAAWVVNSLGTVWRIDPETNSVAAVIPTGQGTTR